MLKKSNCLNFQVEHDGRHHPVQNSKPCRKLRLVMLDWLGAPTWHFARSILNATTGHSNSGSLGVDFETDESNLACVYAYASRHRAIVIVLTSSLIDDVQRESRCVSPCPRGRTSNESSYVRLYLRSLPGRNSYLF